MGTYLAQSSCSVYSSYCDYVPVLHLLSSLWHQSICRDRKWVQDDPIPRRQKVVILKEDLFPAPLTGIRVNERGHHLCCVVFLGITSKSLTLAPDGHSKNLWTLQAILLCPMLHSWEYVQICHFLVTQIILPTLPIFLVASLNIEGVAKVGLQLWVCKTQSLFLCYDLLIIVLFSIWTTVNLLLPHPV